MSRILTALVVATLLVMAVAASAGVTIGSPKDGDVVGPSTPVIGQCSQRAFCIVVSDVMSADGTKIGTVPGIRHWTNDDNSLNVLIATPHVVFGGGYTETVTYVIHVRAYSTVEKAQAADTPDVGEATVTVKSQ
jgi:hypothetical protein